MVLSKSTRVGFFRTMLPTCGASTGVNLPSQEGGGAVYTYHVVGYLKHIVFVAAGDGVLDVVVIGIVGVSVSIGGKHCHYYIAGRVLLVVAGQ